MKAQSVHLPGISWLNLLFAAALPCFLAPVCGQQAGETLYVSRLGNDQWSGRLAIPNADRTDGPLATLAGARDLLRKRKQAGPLPAGGVGVEIAGGLYEQDKPLEMNSQDAGSAGSPIEYRARKGETVRFTGGRGVGGWQPVSDSAVLARLDPAARGQVLQANLKSQGITDLGEMKAGATWGASEPGLELFFKDEPMTLARWPNDGFVRIAELRGTTPVDVRGTKGCKEGLFTYEGDRPQRWIGAPDIMLEGFWFWDWADQRLRVQAIDPKERVIALEAKPEHHFGFRKGQWFYAYNLLCELDRPGEWYLDRATGILYFWPPSPLARDTAVVSVIPSLLKLDGTSHLTFRGLTFECTRGTAIIAANTSAVKFAACTIRNAGDSGMSISGKESGATGCDIYQTANHGVTLNGGDRKTLAPANLYVENCHIHHFSRWNPIYKPAVSISGVGNRVARNLLHDAPHMAISFSGNDHIIEGNEIHSVVYLSNDAGVMYAGYNPTMRGHEIRGNYIHHIYGYESRGCVGVYLDDMFCSAHIHGNIFHEVPRAAFIGGGRDNRVDNNLFVDCNPAIHVDARALGWAAGGVELLKKRLAEMPYQDEPWRSRYPPLMKYLEDEPAVPKGNVIERNVCWGGRWDEIEKRIQAEVVVRDNLLATDPRFAGPVRLKTDPAGAAEVYRAADFALRPDSPAWAAGFKPIEVAKIGLYESPDRATWPVPHTVRPKPGSPPKPSGKK